jgi:uncharacterized protein GlcG (DUF336 family)
MSNVIKKHSASSELAQKMVNAAVEKARELGASENVTILDDAGIPTVSPVAAWEGGFPIKVDGEIVGAIGLSVAPTVLNDVDCAKAVPALVPDAVPAKK